MSATERAVDPREKHWQGHLREQKDVKQNLPDFRNTLLCVRVLALASRTTHLQGSLGSLLGAPHSRLSQRNEVLGVGHNSIERFDVSAKGASMMTIPSRTGICASVPPRLSVCFTGRRDAVTFVGNYDMLNDCRRRNLQFRSRQCVWPVRKPFPHSAHLNGHIYAIFMPYLIYLCQDVLVEEQQLGGERAIRPIKFPILDLINLILLQVELH